MSSQLRYAVPWKQVFGLSPAIAAGRRHSVSAFAAAVVARMDPPPLALGVENLPPDARFVLAANHYQRKGMWILHPASAITQVIAGHYGPEEPPVRWIVTANWPRWRIGPWTFPSPGDILLPKVAYALWCYPVSLAGANPQFTARSLRQLLRDAPKLTRPLGLFPEGVRGSAGQLTEPLAGVGRLIRLLASTGMPLVPVGISEAGRLILRFGPLLSPDTLLDADDPAKLAMRHIAALSG
ncbi:MAG: hypothetical protein NZV14_10175 [Bryobacteraceae bacterium]|nr:hypothetical protein [Bryobacteraceae bacterium]MDW8378519.1 hypothetical protein [Bryobacterales bacterium]